MISFVTLVLAGAACSAGLEPRPTTAPALVLPATAGIDSLHERLFGEGRTFPDFVAAAQRRKAQWEAHHRDAVIADSLVARVSRSGGPWRLLIVTLDGCSDSVNSIPYIAALVDRLPNVEIRLVEPDQGGRPVMEAHRTPDGRAATPTVVLLDATFAERGCWIERPAALREFMDAQRDQLSGNALFDAKMRWYDEEKGAQTLIEIVEMIEAAARGDVRCG